MYFAIHSLNNIYFGHCFISANTDVERLKSETNEQYLLSAAEVIGSIVSLRRPRHILLAKRRANRDSTLGQSYNITHEGPLSPEGPVQTSLPEKTSGEEGTPISEMAQQPKKKSLVKYLKKKIIMVGTKWRGANNQPPPTFSNQESLWTFVGTFVTLLMLLAFSEAITKRNSDLSLVTGPFGVSVLVQLDLCAVQQLNLIHDVILSNHHLRH